MTRTARRPRLVRHAALVIALAPAIARAQEASSAPPTASDAPPPANPSPPPAPSPAPDEPSASPEPHAEATVSSSPPPGASSAPPSAVDPRIDEPEPPLDRFAGSYTVLTARDIARVEPLSTSEMLRYVPGLQLREDDAFGLRLNIGMRGLDPALGGQLTVLEDGVPISLGPYGQNELAYVPGIELVQRIEVLRGMGSLLFGPQAMGGTINFVTTAPPRHELISVRALAGFPVLLGASGTYGNTIGNAGFVISLMRRQGDGPRQSPFEITEAMGRFRLEMSGRSDLTARFDFFDQGATLSGVGLTTPMFDVPAYRSIPLVPNDWIRVRRYSAALIHEFRITDNIRLRTLVHGATTERQGWAQAFDRTLVDNLAYARVVGDASTPGAGLAFRDANNSNAQSYQVVGVEPRLQAGFRLSGFRNELDIGGRLQYERAQLQSLRGGTQWARSGDLVHEELHEGFGVAAYLSDRLYFTDAWQLTAALRFESFSFSAVTRRDAGVDSSVHMQSSNVDLLPGGSLAFVQPTFTLFAGVHAGWLPTRFDQAIDLLNGGVTPHAEHSVNSELGTRVQIADALHAEATLFWIERVDPLVFGARASGLPGWINGAPARHLGGEALVQADFGRLAHLVTNLYVNAQYQYVDARFESGPSAGHVLPYAAPHTVITSVGIEHPMGFGAQVSWRFVSDRFADIANTTTPSIDGRVGVMPAFNTLDISARYTHHDTGLGVTLGAKNLLDMQYVGSRATDGIQPAGFRQIFVAIRWDR